MTRSENKSFYHYKVIETLPDNSEKTPEYFYKLGDIEEKYNISNRIIYCFLKDVNYKSKKLPNIKKIEKCHRPAYIEVKAEYQD